MSVEVDMILGDPSAAAAEANRSYAAFQLSLECAKNEYLTDKDQRATYYLGGICCLMPEVTDDLQEAVRSMGRTVRTISFPSPAARNGLIVPPPNMVKPTFSIALFGYLVITLFRNDTEVVGFIDSSVQYLGALIDYSGLSVFNDVQHWTYIRTTYGQNHEIRKTVLKGILNHTEDGDEFGDVCSYVVKVLFWSVMDDFCFIKEFLSESPILRSPELAGEVSNLNRADKAVTVTIPQLYRILENPEICSMFYSSNFPTLTAVTRKLRLNEEVCKVEYYASIHRNHFRGTSARVNAKSHGTGPLSELYNLHFGRHSSSPLAFLCERFNV